MSEPLIIDSGSVVMNSAGEEMISVDPVTNDGALGFNLIFGGGRGTLIPDMALWGCFDAPRVGLRSLRIFELNDGIDDSRSAARGTREAPTALTGAFLLSSCYGAPFDGTACQALTASRPSLYQTSTAYMRRIAELNMWSAATPTQTQGWGAWTITTANGTQTPLDRMAIKPDGKMIYYANAYEMSGIAYPFNPGDIWQSRMPIPGANWVEYLPDAGHTFLAGDTQLSGNNKCIAVRSLAAPNTEGFSLGLNRNDHELVFYRRWGTTTDSKFMTFDLSNGIVQIGYPNSLTPGREALRVISRSNATVSLTATSGDANNPTRLDLTTSAADAGLDINARGAGVIRLRNSAVTIGQGAQIGAPSGGDMGAGTINVDNGIYRDGLQVVGARLGPIADATSATVLATVNAILAAMRQHGAIAP